MPSESAMLLTTALVALGFVVDTALGAPATAEAAPTVKLGETTVTGQAFPQFGLEFFGGASALFSLLR